MSVAPPEPPEHLPLAALFPEADRDQWRELVAVALRRSGRLAEDAPAGEVEAVLTSVTYDGIEVLPLYSAADAPGPDAGIPGLRGVDGVDGEDGETAGEGWDVRQLHRDPDPARTAEAVLTDLENGATSLWLVLGEGGLPLAGLERVLHDVHLELAPVVLDAGAATEEGAGAFLGLLERRSVPLEAVRANLGADPVGRDPRVAVRLARRCLELGPGLRAVTVDATGHHDAGGSDADELGASLAAGVASLRALTDGGLGIEEAFGQLEFRYAAGADQFLTIAKFRAARRLWARAAEVCGAVGPETRQAQHAVTSAAMMTRRDPWVNLLRTTLAAFGAGVGGADAVTVRPFDAAIGLPDGFSRRLARNTSSLLTMESHVARVVDPARGSWYVERLTEDLAATAWAWFTEIEKAGGIIAARESGLVDRRIAASRARRDADIAHRRAPLTGVSEFPDLAEKPVIRPAPAPAGYRYAQDFEALRDAADAHLARTGARPAVFLATIGPVAVHTARASFAAGLFQAGGLATPDAGAGADPETIAKAFAESGAVVACLASSDRVYAELAAPVAAALKAAGARKVLLAGKKTEAGIDGHVFLGCDALAVLRDVHNLSSVPSAEVTA